MEYKKFWETASKDLKTSLPAHAYEAWIETLTPVGITNNILILEAPNQFAYDWIINNYNDIILSAIKEVDNKVQLKVSIAPQSEQSISATKLDASEPTKQSNPGRRSNINPNNMFTSFIEGPNNVFAKNAATRVAASPGEADFNPLIIYGGVGLGKNIVWSLNNIFTSFIEGPNNVFAKNAATRVAASPGEADFNPLIIYGGVGLGKTHLLHSIANALITGKKQLNVVLASSEKFTNDFIASIQENKSLDFSKVYRKADVLLIDDIQFFQGKEQTQEQFFHTFNELYTAGKQIVMTADRYPGEMVGLQDRLLSRFESGLHADIQPPDFETRVAILSTKAKQNNIQIPPEHLEKIASHVRTNIRDLESCVTKIFAHATLSGETINDALIESIIRERLGDQGYGQANMQDVVSGVCGIFSVSQEEIVGSSRRKNIAEARQVAAYLAREVLDMPLSEIGMHLGGRDHTTIMHAHKKVSEMLKKDDKFRRRVDIIYNELNLS